MICGDCAAAADILTYEQRCGAPHEALTVLARWLIATVHCRRPGCTCQHRPPSWPNS